MAKTKSGSKLSVPKVDLGGFKYFPSGGKKKTDNKTTGSSTRIDDPVGNIAHVPDTTPKDSVTVKEKAVDTYNVEDEEEDLNTGKRRQSEIDSSFTDNPDEWYRRYQYWNENFAKNNPRGNLNGMNFSDTRLMSRLADALNNERHLKPTDIGHRTLHYGSTGTGADQAGSERWEPIETQEMRQMRQSERLDERALQYNQDRQKVIEDYPQKLREQMDKINADLAKYAAQADIDFGKYLKEGVFDKEYKGSWDTYWNTLQHKFAVELGQDMKERIFSKLRKLDYLAGALYASGTQFQSPPTEIISALYGVINEAVVNETDPAIKFNRILAIMSVMGGGLFGAAGNMMLNSFKF